MLKIEQKNGDSEHLRGKLIAYARIEPKENSLEQNSPLDGMVQNGILAVSGDYNEQFNLKDFLRKEFNVSMEEGLGGFIEHLKELGDDMSGGVNPDDLKSKLDSFNNMEIIPVPAKVAFFSGEEEILGQSNVDIYFLGSFQAVSHAHLSVTSFPILYQAQFREQQAREMQNEIGDLLGSIEQGESVVSDLSTPAISDSRQGTELELPGSVGSFSGNLGELLLQTVVPNLIYNQGNTQIYDTCLRRLDSFMKDFGYPEEYEKLQEFLFRNKQHDSQWADIVGLLCQKLSALHHEEFEKLPPIQEKLKNYGL
jgi:hypothetical protein